VCTIYAVYSGEPARYIHSLLYLCILGAGCCCCCCCLRRSLLPSYRCQRCFTPTRTGRKREVLVERIGCSQAGNASQVTAYLVQSRHNESHSLLEWMVWLETTTHSPPSLLNFFHYALIHHTRVYLGVARPIEPKNNSRHHFPPPAKVTAENRCFISRRRNFECFKFLPVVIGCDYVFRFQPLIQFNKKYVGESKRFNV
jgi:hypothetical protein